MIPKLVSELPSLYNDEEINHQRPQVVLVLYIVKYNQRKMAGKCEN
jgi:hypothetical protein